MVDKKTTATLTILNKWYLLFLLLFTVIAKVIPHLPNFSPELVILLYLGCITSQRNALIVILILAVASDVTYGLVSSYPMFGLWTIFTYSGFLFIGSYANWQKILPQKLNFLSASLITNLIFWLWTNFGIWISHSYYPHSFSGLLQCYILALPFLKYALSAAVIWSVITIVTHRYLIHKKAIVSPV